MALETGFPQSARRTPVDGCGRVGLTEIPTTTARLAVPVIHRGVHKISR